MASEDACVFVYDCRSSDSEVRKIYIGGVFSYLEFREKVMQDFQFPQDENFVIATTNRDLLADDKTYLELIEPGDTLYLLHSLSQALITPVSEKIEFQPHYDTLIKSGIYEYYASEGQTNPLPFAFAELIDNALAATVKNNGSRKIELFLNFDDSTYGTHSVCVLDNGKGMTSRQLNDWAIYRLSKFNRRRSDANSVNLFEEALLTDEEKYSTKREGVPKSLNSDISWFGVGGKQAIFFIGSATRIITRSVGSCDVHEFSLSKEEFKRKEANREMIYGGYIRNRPLCDFSHISKSEGFTKKLIMSEGDADWKTAGFTNIVITGIDPSHILFMKQGFGVWTRQLAHIYHYYIHGPEGNSPMSKERRNIGATDVDIAITLLERGKRPIKIHLRDIIDDLESQYIRTTSDSFEFQVKTDGGCGIVEGTIRYHPFLYDRETFPLDPNGGELDVDQDNYTVLPARGRRPMFECFWNGRLIPYTFVEDFDWCRIPKKKGSIPTECYYRTSGCLFTNHKFQVSTNKLTFIDLEAKLRDRATVFSRVIMGQQQRAQIQKQFHDWLKDCHEKYDKQIKFLNFIECFQRTDAVGKRIVAVVCSAYRTIEWGKKTFKEGQLVRSQRINPPVFGRIRRFILNGSYEGDVYAVGGDVEVAQEPAALYGDVKCVPISKLDLEASDADVQHLIREEEGKLPNCLCFTWPEGNEIMNGEVLESGVTIGAMRVEIHNSRGESMQKLHCSAGSKRLLVEQRLLHKPDAGEAVREVACHITTHGRTWPYWFKKMENIKEVGKYAIQLQTVLNESGKYTYADGGKLPEKEIEFRIKSAPPQRFIVGMLESPLRIGVGFNIPLELQDENGHPASPSTAYSPLLQSEGLELSYGDVEYKKHGIILKEVIGIGTVLSHHGKNFIITVIVSGLARSSQSMRLRLLPGVPNALRIDSITRNGEEEKATLIQGDSSDEEHYYFDVENMSNLLLNVSVIDIAGNVTLQNGIVVHAKFSANSGISLTSCDCSVNGKGTLSGQVTRKKLTTAKTVKGRISVPGLKTVHSILCHFCIKPSTNVAAIEIFHGDNLSENPDKIKQGTDIFWPAGEILPNLRYCLFDEAMREVAFDKKNSLCLKVNWTKNMPLDMLNQGNLPEIKAPTNVKDTKYCEVIYSGDKKLEFSFNIRPLPGEPSSLRCTILGRRDTQIGVIRSDPIAVTILDIHGNKLEAQESELNMISVSGEGMDAAVVEKSVEDGDIYLSNIQLNQGPLGGRELCVSYGNSQEIKEFVLLQLVAGTPATMQVYGWSEYKKPVTILSGMRIQDPIKVQLLDGWGNPVKKKGVKILLGKDSAVKLTPSPGMLLTDENGAAVFPKFAVHGKRGEYNLQPRAVINRTAIEGPNLKISVIPNTETPASIDVKHCCSDNSVIAGCSWPDFEVSVLSEEGSLVTSKVYLCMAVWKKQCKRETSIPSNARFHRQEHPCLGHQVFHDIQVPTKVGLYCVCFSICETPNSRTFRIISEIFCFSVSSGQPYQLQHVCDPGMPTVSNTTIARTIIHDMTLVLHDNHGNITGKNITGIVSVSIKNFENTDKDDKIPTFDGNAEVLHFNMTNGKVQLTDISLQENSPGCDGYEYMLCCKLVSDEVPSELSAYCLKFLFYNDAVKQNLMSVLVRKRETLRSAIESYESLFSLHRTLLKELKNTLRDAENRKKRLSRELQNCNIYLPVASSLEDVENMIDGLKREQESLISSSQRKCSLKEYPDKSADILGKIGHLALVEDDDIACVLSWHMMGDMDCLVTTTSEKAREVHKATGGMQQLLSLDSIYKRNLPNDKKVLPHLRKGVKGLNNCKGNPVYARELLQFPKEAESCEIVFRMLLGETLIMDDLETASYYRSKVVQYAYCPTILTRSGDRIRSNGKFGGNQNRAVSVDRLRGSVFGAPLPSSYHRKTKQIELLTDFRRSVVDTDAALAELTNHEASVQTDEMLQKKQEHKEAIERLKEIEVKIDINKRETRSVSNSAKRHLAKREQNSASPSKKSKENLS